MGREGAADRLHPVIHSKWWLLSTVFVLVYAVAARVAVSAAPSALPASMPSDSTVAIPSHNSEAIRAYQEPYCGLYCVYASAKALGKEIAFPRLVDSAYVGSGLGSSLSELERAATDVGMHAMVVQNLTLDELHNGSPPIILHVKATALARNFGHFVLFLGRDNAGRWEVFNPSTQIEHWSAIELSSRWAGVGVVVSDRPIRAAELSLSYRKSFVNLALVMAVLLLGVAVISRLMTPASDCRGRIVRSGVQCLFVLGIGSIAGIGYHLFSSVGFLSDTGNTSLVESAAAPTFLPMVEVENVVPLSKQGTVFIDARLPEDYDEGHLPTAINVPVTMSIEDMAKRTAAVPKNADIVIYCQDRSCPFASEVAKGLSSLGYTKLSIFAGGWNAWRDFEIAHGAIDASLDRRSP